ncbi:endoplasmic reticulum-based factor for assembly of V-ATPase-domain-containing protein [Xylariaceae sp. FL0662B]|nr:endoplasmic reticulum-based factor for assembly of V-ATPase-domain-containing protein [Xylariaceae sp. FL0662B]
MVLLTMTSSIVEALETSPEPSGSDVSHGDESNSRSKSQSNGEPSLEDPSVGKPISHGQIIDIWTRSKNRGQNAVKLEDLLRGATVYIPPPTPKPEPTDEYKALMARLRREEEERSYERMLKKAPPRESFAHRFPMAPLAHSFAEANRPSKSSDIGEDIENGEVQKQVTLIINFLISIVGCGAALWMASRWWSIPARLFLSLGGSIVVAIAEFAVYSAYTWRMAEGEKTQRKTTEVKEIVKTWVVGDDADKGTHESPQLLKDAPGSDRNLRRRVVGQT